MKMIFLVDGDNNIGTGLQGIDLLTAEDTVLVFFGKGQTLANVKKLCAGTKAQVQYLESVKGGKNSLDFQIITELGVLVGRGEADFAYVISQDKGYEAAMSALHARYASTFREVALRPSIQDCLQAAFLLRAGTREELAAALARERVYAELCGFLPAARVEDFGTFAPVILAAIPALTPTLGFQQHNPHHIFDVYTHTAHVVAAVPPTLSLRWAALLHDVAKPACFTQDDDGVGHFRGHAHLGAKMAREILQQLRAPRALEDRVATLIAYHGVTRDLGRLPGDKPLRRLLRRLGEEVLWELLALDRADDSGKGTPSDPAAFDRFEASLRQLLAEQPCLTTRDLAISGRDLLQMGLPQGPILGRILQTLLEEVGDGLLPNTPEALLHRAEGFLDLL